MDPLEYEIRSCLSDLCQRISLMFDESYISNAIIYNPVPSPVFKRKMEESSPSNRRNKGARSAEEPQSAKKKRNRSSNKKVSNTNSETTQANVVHEKKEEPIEQEPIDVKPTLSMQTVVAPSVNPATFDYFCEWDNCRKYDE